MKVRDKGTGRGAIEDTRKVGSAHTRLRDEAPGSTVGWLVSAAEVMRALCGWRAVARR